MTKKIIKKEKTYSSIKPRVAGVSEENALKVVQEISDWLLREFNAAKVEMLVGMLTSGRLAYSDKTIKFKVIDPIDGMEFLTVKRLRNSEFDEFEIDPIAMQTSENPRGEMEKIVRASTGLSEEQFGQISFDEVGFIFGLVNVFFL